MSEALNGAIEWYGSFRDFLERPDAVGCVVELSDGTFQLVGTVNDLGGGCDCCRVPASDRVVRFARVWRHPDDD